MRTSVETLEETRLAVTEIFGPTFQGEGPSCGQRAMFLRLGGCNLACSWCDTPYTWDWSQYDPDVEVHMMALQDIVVELVWRQEVMDTPCLPALLVITGGEPMLQAGKLKRLIDSCMFERVEIETNGTILPDRELADMRSVYFNVSPKLESSGNQSGLNREWWRMPRARFKFVVTANTWHRDLIEVDRITEGEDPSRVWIMPEATDRNQLQSGLETLADTVLRNGWNLSTRLHVQLWGTQRGR